MSLFGFLKKKKGSEDFESVRSHILGEPINEPVSEPMPEEYPPVERAPPSGYGRFGTPNPPPLREDIEAFEPFAPRQEEPKAGNAYDISQRLDIIESQLSAIRSQTETINERLKNMEMKISRRY